MKVENAEKAKFKAGIINVCGMSAQKPNEIQKVVLANKYDYFCLLETWANNIEPPPGYKIIAASN